MLSEPKDAAVALHRLRHAKQQSDLTWGCDGHTYLECSMDRARLIGEHCESFYATVHQRCRQYLVTMRSMDDLYTACVCCCACACAVMHLL